VTKFTEGAWIIIVLTPALVAFFFTIHHHYKGLAKQLSLDNSLNRPMIRRNRVILLISGVHQGTLSALRYARYLSNDVTAVHISTDPAEAEKVEAKWDTYGEGCRLVILNSPYRLLLEPLLEYLAQLQALKKHNETITIVVPAFVPKNSWANVLHMRTADTLRKVLRNRKDLVIIEVPYQVD
jgi:hypothetical protein